MITGTYNDASFTAHAGLRGEAGLDYLTAPLHGVRFTNEGTARTWVVCTLVEMFGESMDVPRVRTNRRFGRRLQGRYTCLDQLIQLAPHYSLHIVAHELAHHVTWVQGRYVGHGAIFKAAFRALLKHAYGQLGMEIPPAPARTQRSTTLPRVGTEVIVNSPKHGVYLGTVRRRNRTRCVVQREDGMMFNVHGSIMEWDE